MRPHINRPAATLGTGCGPVVLLRPRALSLTAVTAQSSLADARGLRAVGDACRGRRRPRGRRRRRFSPDGQWVAYGINRTNRNNELRVTKIADASTKTFAFGGGQAFSADSKWLAYSITHSEAEQERLRAANRPVQNSLGVLNLATGESTTVDGIESFAFSGDGKYLAMRRYQPAPPAGAGGAGANAPAGGRGGRGGGGGGDATDDRPGATLIVRDLASGRDTTFGNVSEFAWQDADARTCSRWRSAPRARSATACSSSTRRRPCCACSIRRRRRIRG